MLKFNIFTNVWIIFFCCILILKSTLIKYAHKNINRNLNEINKWIYKCSTKILIKNKILNSPKKPKITALTTIFNSEKNIHIAINSIKNQILADIEILLVDDGSTDKSLSVIREFQEEDKRIKIIQNKRNRGALYSKSIGILKAKGQYIMLLDSDDLFANENIFKICFEQANKNNIDIIEFSGYNLFSEYFKLNTIPEIPYYLRFKQNNELVLQPELSFFIYEKLGKNKFKLIDGYLWGKCIKNVIFKMALKIIDSNIYLQKVNYGDDRIINFILFKIANSFKYIQEYGIIYKYNNFSTTNFKNYINNCHDELLNLFNIYNYTKNTKEIEIAAYEIVYRWELIILPGLRLDNFKSLRKLLKRLLLNKYISFKRKKILLSFFRKLKQKKSFFF